MHDKDPRGAKCDLSPFMLPSEKAAAAAAEGETALDAVNAVGEAPVPMPLDQRPSE
jgi:hypothetical protein